MNRRQAMAAMGGVVLVGESNAADPAPTLKVSVVLPELYALDGKLTLPPTLRNAGYGLCLHVLVANVSKEDVYVWAEGNSAGHGILSFEVTGPDGTRTVVKRTPRIWTKNVLRLEKLAPGGYHVRAVEYDALPGKDREWEPFPFGPKDSRVEVTLRAVFEQPKIDSDSKLAVWGGRAVSPACKVVLLNA
jgi:hypothetical protein